MQGDKSNLGRSGNQFILEDSPRSGNEKINSTISLGMDLKHEISKFNRHNAGNWIKKCCK